MIAYNAIVVIFLVKSMRNVVVLVFMLFAGLFSGCANHDVLQDASYKILTQPYQLDSGDELRVTVFEQANLSTTYTVDQAGFVTMPLIGTVPARGRTTQQLSGDIATRLKQGFVRDPDVAIEVQTFRPFFIYGEVANGGQYEYVTGMTIQTAIAIGGGFSPRANRQVAIITRQINGEIQHAKADLNTPVRPGDTITVKERLF